MRRRSRTFATALVLGLALLVVLPGNLRVVRGSDLRPVPGGERPVRGWTTDARAIPGGSRLSAVPSGREVALELTLVPTDPGALASLAAAVADPASPEYRQFLSEPSYERQFDPPASADRALAAYFDGFGASSIVPTADRLGLRVELPVGGAEAALGIRYEEVRPAVGAAYVTAVGTAHLPPALEGTVQGIGGLVDLGPNAVQHDLRTVRSGAFVARGTSNDVVVNRSSGQRWNTGTDFAQGYGASALMPSGAKVANSSYASKEAVATILISGYNNTTQANLAPWDPAVLDAYFNDTFPNTTGEPYQWPQPVVTGVPVPIDQVTPPVPGSLGNLSDDSLDEEENSLDLEMAGSFAPGAEITNFYFAESLAAAGLASTNASALGDVADDFALTLSAAMTHDYGNATLVAISNSYGLPDLNDSLWDAELVHAAVTGVTVVAASGDQGDAPDSQTGDFQGSTPTWPGSAAFNSSGDVAIGGTTVNLSAQPTGYYDGSTLSDPFDATVTGISSDVAWYDTLGGSGALAGSEGGASTVLPEPSWQNRSAAQSAIVNATVLQGAKTLGRAEPDLAFAANNTLVYVAANGSTLYFDTVEGTSVAAPLFAGLLAEIAAVSGHSYGFLTPELYRIGSYYAANPTAGGNPFLDITQGSNYLFSAAPGWDAVTGWGSLDAETFLSADRNPAVANYQYSGPSLGLPTTGTPSTPATPNALWIDIVVLGVLAIVAVFAVLAVVLGSRPKRPAPYYGSVPPGTYAPTPGGPPPPFGPGSTGAPPATFLCPYCGSVRPAEPVRCPACGAF